MTEAARTNARITVDRLSVRLPGESSVFARRVVERSLRLVEERLSSNVRSGELSKLELKVRATGSSERALSHAIAAALVRALEGRGRK